MKNKITFNLMIIILFASSLTSGNLFAQSLSKPSSNNTNITSQSLCQHNVLIKDMYNWRYCVFVENRSFSDIVEDGYSFKSKFKNNNTIYKHKK